MIPVSDREIARYLGYQGYSPTEDVKKVIAEVLSELSSIAHPKSLYRTETFSIDEEGLLHLGPLETDSRDLEKNLRGCTQVILLGATLGTEVDLYIHRFEKLDMLKAVVAQACGAALIEGYVDQVQDQLKERYEKEGLYMRPRFSPGYGDFPLTIQPRFLEVLELSRRIGIKLTDGLLMIPAKSVTAVIGLSPSPFSCDTNSCDLCGRESCPYRRA